MTDTLNILPLAFVFDLAALSSALGESVLLAQDDGMGAFSSLPLFLALGLLLYFMIIRPQKREREARQAMIEALKKNDRVVTIGGIYGIVTNVHREADEVTLKVDESSNTKLRVTLGSIARIISGDERASESTSK